MVVRCLALLAVVALVLTCAAADPARARDLSVRDCALGTSARDLRGFYAAELARMEGRFAARVRDGRAKARAIFATGVAAYVYGLAPIAVGQTVQRFPENQLVSIAALVNPAVQTVVLPNVDTTYTVGRLQLGAGTRVLDVPDTNGRYYVIQLLDAYSNTFAYVGRRTTGTRAGSFAILPPGHSPRLPPGVRRIRSPTNLVWVLGRTLVRDAADLTDVADVMRGYRVTGLDAWAAGQRQAPLVLPAFPATPPVVLPTGLDFFAELAEVLRTNPPPDRDACAIRAFGRLGIGREPVPGSGRPGLARRALEAATRAGERLLERAELRANGYSARRNNGWLLPGSYVGSYGRNYLGRGLIAKVALGANTRPETVYPVALSDIEGRPLHGRHRYTLRFRHGELPPADAFWSLTMYGEDRYLVPNPIDRYAVGDRTEGLRRGRDGSLTIYVQHSPPRGAARANWLPAPRGRFRLAMRIYEPRRSALTEHWEPPAVRRR